MTTDFHVTLLSEEDQEILGRLDKKSITPVLLQHAEHPRNTGALLHPDGQSEVTGICEDTIGFHLRIRQNRISEIAFQAKGCGFTLACGSITTELVQSRTLQEALAISGKQIESALGGLPKGHRHCADLAASALKAAIKNAQG